MRRSSLGENEALWTELAATINIKDPKTVAVLRDSLRGVYTAAWNPTVIGEIRAVATEGYALLGTDFLPAGWDDKAFDLRFEHVR